jgi:hypothetical protein
MPANDPLPGEVWTPVKGTNVLGQSYEVLELYSQDGEQVVRVKTPVDGVGSLSFDRFLDVFRFVSSPKPKPTEWERLNQEGAY